MTTSLTDAADLRGFGYQPELRRSIGSYASFAAGFSFVSILTTVFQLFGFGFSFGGPAFFWTWPLVFFGQFMVALTFAELAARYPLSGCIYQWSRRLSNATVGWFAGWIMIIAQIVTVAAAAIALQVVLPQIWSGFQPVGGDPALTSTSGATNAVLLGSILIVLTTLVNVIGVRLMAIINSTGVTLEIIGVVAVVVLLLFNVERGPGVVFDTGGMGSGASYVGPFLVSALMAAYVVVGFDSAGELSEETRDPRHTAPRTILRALAASGIGGGLMLLVALMAAPSLTDGRLATEGLPYVLTSRLGETGGKILLVDVAIAVAVCTLAIQTAGSRMVFSMARDGVLPFSAALSKVNPRTGTPALPAIVVGAGAAGVLLVNIGQAALFTALTSVCIVLLYLAYALVTVPLLIRRIKGRPSGAEAATTERGGKLFSLGKAGIVVNVVAVLYGLGMILNLGWPRPEVYDPAGAHWYLHYFSLLFVGGALVAGGLAYLRYRTRALSLHLPAFPAAVPAVVTEGEPA
ncbi:putative amino-acid permease [Actinoplanes ianthinogenes]|uniref:Amino-acid permease n=1 Tax=Actinoplanes ianthinogenes TaxID=122358 RepID=A0ABN6CQ20_9ACTN|nr:amino acid permease [Actinoplanes ianthinogenes]BCJ47311.1 putative amino-acid permease [Actinoplanes ianthinogenes]GGR42075.1 putative amino-acid permease [Actinoplanes ianthinogenes]